MIHPEIQYLNLINKIVRHGIKERTRNGKTKTIMGAIMKFPLNNNIIPIMTTKKMAWKTCFKELFWFINGETDNNILKEQKVHIWDGNASRDFLNSRGLHKYEEGDLGPIYGYQWRNFDLPYRNSKHYKNLKNSSIYTRATIEHADQLQNIIDCLKDEDKRNSRRLVMSAWNPNQINDMALPPCHILSQFSVLNNKLYCNMYQRSADIGLGVPFNIASYSLLTILLAKHCDLQPGEFIHHIGNAHIYEDHESALLEQVSRLPYVFPKCEILNKYDTIEEYSMSDISIKEYKYHSKVNMSMVV